MNKKCPYCGKPLLVHFIAKPFKPVLACLDCKTYVDDNGTIRTAINATTKVEIVAKDPMAKTLLKSALKWVRRIEERADELPTSFLDNCDPKPLRKDMERYLSTPTERRAEG